MHNTSASHIRPMCPGELGTALQWAAREGWNPGLHDAACFYAADPQGFLVGLVGGEPIACISVVRYGADYGFLGLYIVQPEYRGRGHGWALWQAGMAHLGARAVGLDGVVAQQANYRRSGFALAHRNVRYQGAARHGGGGGAVDLRTLDWQQVLDCDRPCFPAGRAAFLHAWVHQDGHRALGLMQGGRLAAYGVIRPCLQGYKIGPLIADDAAQAETLLRALMACVPEGSAVFLDIPQPNAAAVVLAEGCGMAPVFETARMYKGASRLPDMQRTFGIGTFELG
ncbi:GNAT family N-acetyltransferase [Acidovorax sp. SDU_ACID1]|uniref:GNAT family N-acetyltransferase n=1 Tax=Acidovorax sp. SDU_ACID1 TaxID=3136632 RepID=UPI0038738A80